MSFAEKYKKLRKLLGVHKTVKGPKSNVPPLSEKKSSTKPKYLSHLERTISQAVRSSKRGDWEKAAERWQDAIGEATRFYVELSIAHEKCGDFFQAEAVIRSAFAIRPGDPLLLRRYCELALVRRAWSSVPARWEKIEQANAKVPATFKARVVEAFLNLGRMDKVKAILEATDPSERDDEVFLRLDADILDRQGDWREASDKWFAAAAATASGARRTRRAVRGVRSLINAGDLALAEERCVEHEALFDGRASLLEARGEIAIARNDWPGALGLWREIEAADGDKTAALPVAWVQRIGVNDAAAQTEALQDPGLRAIGYMALANTLKPFNEAEAIRFARKARRAYPAPAMQFVSSILEEGYRHSAAIWWLSRLVKIMDDPLPAYAIYVDALIESSRLDECEQAVRDYAGKYGMSTLYLRAMSEILYRRGDFAGLEDLLAEASRTRLAKDKPVHVFLWLTRLVSTHPDPASFLPAELHDPIIRAAYLHDGRQRARVLSNLFNAEAGKATYDANLELLQAADDGEALDATTRTDMVSFFQQRGNWQEARRVLAPPTLMNFDKRQVAYSWRLCRAKADTFLTEARIDEAEAEIVAFLQRLREEEQDDYVVKIALPSIQRLPFSRAIVDAIEQSARRLDHHALAARAADWRERYAGRAFDDLVGKADKKRCFIVGNGPSLATMPLHLLEGEDLFCVNRGMRAMGLGLPRPRYLVVGDKWVYKSHTQEIDNDAATVESFFVASSILWERQSRQSAVPYGTSGLKLSLAPFECAPWYLHRGETVILLAAQIAQLMGYEEIYIIGVDLDYAGPQTHFYGGGVKERERLHNFRPGGSGPLLANEAFRNLRIQMKTKGGDIFNAAPGGNLNSLPRVDFAQLLNRDAHAGSASR